MNKYTKYDFEAMKTQRFPKMTDREVMREYVMVLNELKHLQETEDEQTYFEYCEPLTDAEYFLCGYLARMVCCENGFDI